MFSSTFMFKQCIRNFLEFQDFIEEYTILNKEDLLHHELYLYLNNFYCNSNVLYDTAEGFVRHFMITYQNIYRQYKKRFEMLDYLYNMEKEDIITLDVSIINNSFNNNEEVADPLNTIVNYVSSQASSKTRANQFTTFVQAIELIQDNLIDTFLDKFRKHFTKIYPMEGDLY